MNNWNLFFKDSLAIIKDNDTALQTTRNYGDDVWRLSALEIAFSGGMILGGRIAENKWDLN